MARLRAIFESALQRPPDEREAFAREAAQSDEMLANSVIRLLRFASSPTPHLGEAFAQYLDAPSGDHPETIGRYNIRGRLGEGGMGEVFRAFDPDLQREVALKTLRPMLSRDPQALERLQREARIAGKLEHPNLCPILDLQRSGDQTYVVMPLLKGHSLDTYLRTARANALLPEEFWLALPRPVVDSETSSRPAAWQREQFPALHGLLRILERVARGVHAAHEAGVLHRDLKPSNIMLQPDGSPIVLDFGLAKDISESLALTGTHDVLGSPPYMSPEQVNGDLAAVDRRSDVYALGVLIYELTTLRRPYESANRDSLFAAILRGDPIAPRRLCPAMPRDLEAVCLQAMAALPRHRYATAEELANDLASVRLGQPTAATPLPGIVRWLRRAKRSPRTIAIAGATAALIGVLLSAWIVAHTSQASRGGFVAAIRAIERAHRAGSQLPAEAVAVLATVVADDRVRNCFLTDPLDANAQNTIMAWALENMRGDEPSAGIELLGPCGTIVSPQPLVRFRSGLPASREWSFVVTLEHPVTGETHSYPARQPLGAGSDAVEVVPATLPASGTWRVGVRLTPPVEGLDWPAAHGEFAVMARKDYDSLVMVLPRVDDEQAEAQVGAAILLTHGLAEAALARLDAVAAKVNRLEDRARMALLRMRAFAVLGDRRGRDVAGEEWRRIREAAKSMRGHEER